MRLRGFSSSCLGDFPAARDLARRHPAVLLVPEPWGAGVIREGIPIGFAPRILFEIDHRSIFGPEATDQRMDTHALASIKTKTGLIRRALLSGRVVELRITGTSMIPTLWPGDLVSVEPARRRKLLTGDLVVFQRDERLIVHRIVGRDQAGAGCRILTRGDTQIAPGDAVPESDVLGLVAAIHRFGVRRPVMPTQGVASRTLSRITRRSDRFRHLLFHLNRTLRQRRGAADPIGTAW